MQVLPSTHFVSLSQAVLYRGADIDIIWPQLLVIAAEGAVFLAVALSRFKAMLARQA